MDRILEQNIEQKAKEFLERNIRETDHKDDRLACGDGRYLDSQSQGAIRIFGEDMGVISALWAVEKEKKLFETPEQCIDEYRKAKSKVFSDFDIDDPYGTLYFHTDSHAKEHGGYGCGHMKHLSSGHHTMKYEVDDKDIDKLFQTAISQDHTVVTPLDGDHREEMVILVHGADGKIPKYTTRSFDTRANEMNFIVDFDRVMDYLNRLAKKLNIPGVTGKRLQNSYLQHQKITAGILAEGKPIVHAYIDLSGKIKVEYKGEKVAGVE